ncbi:MAG TPA: glycosyltransferase family 1 protein [Clostridiaceae bacterium]|jgi:glycosyltransferase involved in cell wall biosynthesis|nr:glycosyltransferase family 1 protein [Clostridiaceae bacterium]HBG38250.1 glycosyltransferase family 1 protein [Clostridiaceae bacterium]HBN27719.1 glycosyltransferase family 1 protein [Clostridiaceae bacterium]HBX47949.1 glycosyltransferase family 1 protein [Clostridiaceae bacterium]HCL50017.1 glycosyltransferase family 1 protein [Clostridiaceae bacterium]
MKIGVDGRAGKWYRGTGIGTYTYQLINNINLIDKKNNYLLFLPEEGLNNINFSENVDIELISENSKETFWEEVDIPNILNDKDMDIYHVPQNGIGLPTEKNCRFVITLHDVIPYKLPETVGPQYLKIYLDEIPKMLPLLDGIITVSNYSKDDIAETLGFPKEKIFVTHLAAEDIYIPLNKNYCNNYIKEKYGIENKFILYVGGFSPRKNIKGLISAFSTIKSKLKDDFNLVILGKRGRSYYDYRDLSYSLGLKNDVIFTGYVPVEDLPIFYNAAYISCYPSFYEGFGLPPLESMACGTPAVSSNKTSMPEILGDDAIYVDPYDIDDMAEKVLNLIQDKKLYEDMVYKGLKRSSMYSWKKAAIETIDVFRKISRQ